MPYYTMTEIAKMHNVTATQLSRTMSSKSCIYRDPNHMKKWNVYDSFTKGVTAPFKRCGNSILWSEEMLPRIDKIFTKKTVINSTTNSTSRKWYLRKYHDKFYGDVFQMTRDIYDSNSEYAPLDDSNIRYKFNRDCNYLGIISNGRKNTKLLVSIDPNYNKWSNYMEANKL